MTFQYVIMARMLIHRNLLVLSSVALLSALAVGVSDCLPASAKAPAKKRAARPAAKRAPAKQPAAKKAVPADQSLTTEEYINLGMPGPDRTWSDQDMLSAVRVLENLSKSGYQKFPRYQSPRSGAIFSQMTSPKNLEVYADKSLSLEGRLPNALSYYRASNQLFKFYLNGFLKDQVRDSELIEFFGAVLRSTVSLLDLTDELLPTIKKDDPNYDTRMQGMQKMKSGLGSIVSGCLLTLTERQSYRRSELLRLIGYMQETFPTIVKRLSPSGQTETLVKLQQMQKDPKLKDLQPDLGQLQALVKAAQQ